MPDWEAVVLSYVKGYDAGIGLLRSTGEPKNKSIKGLADGVTLTPGGSGTTFITRVETTEQLETELGINASARGGIGIFRADDKFEFSNKCKINEYSLAIIIKSEQQVGFIQIDELELTDAAKALASSNPEGFVDQFGDCFIRGISRGGELFIVVRIDTRSRESRETIKNTLNVSGFGTLFSAELMVSLNEAVKNTSSRTEILLHNIGGVAAPVGLSTPDQIANVLGPWITSVQATPAPFGVSLAPYKLVTGFDPPRAAEIQHQQDILLRCDKLRYYAMDCLNQLDFVMSNIKVFPGIDIALFSAARAGFASDIDVIAAARSFAVRNPIQALEPEGYARIKLLRPDYKLSTLPAPMPQLPPMLLIVPALVGYDPSGFDGIRQLLANYSIDDIVNSVPLIEQGAAPEDTTPRSLVEFLAAFKGDFVVDHGPGYSEQGRNTVTFQDPTEDMVIDPGDTIRLRAGN